jgi:MFS superfamily sulfate permease-like transporter
VPLQNGLHAAAAGSLIYALFCTSRQISTGPSSSLAAVAGGAVLVIGLRGTDAAELARKEEHRRRRRPRKTGCPWAIRATQLTDHVDPTTVSHTLVNIVTMQEKLTHERNGTMDLP